MFAAVVKLTQACGKSAALFSHQRYSAATRGLACTRSPTMLAASMSAPGARCVPGEMKLSLYAVRFFPTFAGEVYPWPEK